METQTVSQMTACVMEQGTQELSTNVFLSTKSLLLTMTANPYLPVEKFIPHAKGVTQQNVLRDCRVPPSIGNVCGAMGPGSIGLSAL